MQAHRLEDSVVRAKVEAGHHAGTAHKASTNVANCAKAKRG